MLEKERLYYSPCIHLIVGVDEAGRGPLAGPVYAGACLFDPAFRSEEINDSKKLSAKKRDELFDLVKANALGYGIAAIDAPTIDKINIYEATKLAMKAAIGQIKHPYDLIITDAMPLSGLSKDVVPLIKGDATCLNVAAASILAKVSRDRYMEELDNLYPMFGFAKHKGYGTALHLKALQDYGPIKGVHRESFAPVKERMDRQIKLF